MSDVEILRKAAFALSPADQYRLACFVAENVGYVLKPDTEHPDSPHAVAQPEPAAWQHRNIYRDGRRGDWCDCDAEYAETLMREFPDYTEVRPLYVAPPSASR